MRKEKGQPGEGNWPWVFSMRWEISLLTRCRDAELHLT